MAEAAAAQLLAAVAIAADNGSLLADADLAHIDAGMQLMGELADELAEIDAVLCREVADDLLAAEEILDADRLHIETGLMDMLAEDRHGLLAELGKMLCVGKIGLCRDAEHTLERRRADRGFERLVVHLARVADCKADLGAALRRDDYMVGFAGTRLLRIEPELAQRVLELDRDDGGHVSASLMAHSMTSRVSWDETLWARLWRASPTAANPAMMAGVPASAMRS